MKQRSPSPRGLRVNGAPTALVCTVLLAGCTGGGTFNIVSLQMRDLGDDQPLVSTFRPGECYYWIDEDGRINVALHYRNIPWLGPLSRVTFDLSLELEEPPAGRARQYAIRSREFRGRAELGAFVHRFMSYQGIASVWVDGPSRIRGRFKTLTRHESFNILTGWLQSAPLLFVGEFRAVLDAEKGRAIHRASAADEWVRPPRSDVPLRLQRPTTQPATTKH